MNICMIGHGMMGTWHSEALSGQACCLHTLVGRCAEQTEAFAKTYGYRKWTVQLEDALNDPAVDAMIIAGPSETHAEMALAAIAHGKHLLVEIPIAMNLADAQRVVDSARERGVTLGVVHPMRFRIERAALIQRLASGEETLRHVHGRFFIWRLQNIGATGYRRSWIDNILWHHTTHLIDLGLWLLGAGDMRQVETQINKIDSFMPALDPDTGIPMEIMLTLNTHAGQSIVATGSYYCRERIYDTLVVSNRNSYRLDELSATLVTGDDTQKIVSEQENAWRIARDFIAALHQGREPWVPGWSVLPTMRVLHRAQAQWDAVHGAQVLPGRPVI